VKSFSAIPPPASLICHSISTVASAPDCPDVAKAIARYSPVSVSVEAADFARALVVRAAPNSVGRAKALLFAARLT
jgi:hypothetical protein